MAIAPIPTDLALQSALPTRPLGFEGPSSSTGPSSEGVAGGLPFVDVLKNALASANTSAQAANRTVEAFAAGAVDDIHGTMIATKEAEIELKLVANVRSKLVEAFNDLWRMSI